MPGRLRGCSTRATLKAVARILCMLVRTCVTCLVTVRSRAGLHRSVSTGGKRGVLVWSDFRGALQVPGAEKSIVGGLKN